MHRQIVESEDYKDQFEKFGNSADLDEALRALMWSLAVRPEVWDLVPGYKRVRLATTDPTDGDNGPIPALKIWFEILEDDSVFLLYLEADE